LERKISESNQELQNYVSEIRDEMKIDSEIDSEVESKLGPNIEDATEMTDEISSKVTGGEIELNDKITDSSKDVNEKDDKPNDIVQKVQVEDDNCTEENLKRQGEKAAQLNVKRKYIHGELLEELDMTQVKGVTLIQDKTSNNQISPAEADHGIVIKSTDENTLNCKSIYLFTKYGYACSSRTVRIDITVYERDRIISYNKVTKYKKYRRLEWCINSKRKK
jgi:hypothetical protein